MIALVAELCSSWICSRLNSANYEWQQRGGFQPVATGAECVKTLSYRACFSPLLLDVVNLPRSAPVTLQGAYKALWRLLEQ